MTDVELGLDTFGDVTRRRRAHRCRTPRSSATSSTGGARRRARPRLLRRRRAPPRGLRRLGARGRARRDRRAPTRIQLGSAVTVLSSDDPVRVFQRFATLDALSERARRGHPRPRLVHRVVPAVRLRPRRVRGAVRGEARPVRRAAARRARHLVGDDPRRRSTSQQVFPPTESGEPARRGSASAAAPSRSCAPRTTACR